MKNSVNLIDPTESQRQAFFDTEQADPVIFVNCHLYFPRARYPEDFSDDRYPTDVTGREAYHRYLKEVAGRFVTRVGGRIVLAGPVEMVFIGEGQWDEIVMGQYPSKAAAMRVPTLPGYDEIAIHRTAGLQAAQTLVLNPSEFLFNELR